MKHTRLNHAPVLNSNVVLAAATHESTFAKLAKMSNTKLNQITTCKA